MPPPLSPSRPVVLGLMGGIASGKSALARLLVDRGALWLNADAIAHEVLRDPPVVEEVAAQFGDEVRGPDGIDRAALGRAVFDDRDRLAALEALIHPRVQERMRRALDEATAKAVVLDIPLLLEKSPLRNRVDLFIFVDATDEVRRGRGERFRGWSPEELSRREAHQIPLEEKRRHADVVLDNSSTPEALAHQVDAWLAAVGGFDGLPRRATPDPEREAPDDDPRPSGPP